MKTPKKRPVGRPRIAGKEKYTLSLKTANVEAFRKVRDNLSAFVDGAIESFLKVV